MDTLSKVVCTHCEYPIINGLCSCNEGQHVGNINRSVGPSQDLPENPKDLIGSDKIPIHLFPATAVVYGALGNLDGALKYGRNNWRAAGIQYTIYLDAIIRHAQALAEGEDIDPDSGLPHECHILATAGIIVDAKESGRLIDDRNYRGSFWRGFVGKMTNHVKRLKEKHKDKNPKHWVIDND